MAKKFKRSYNHKMNWETLSNSEIDSQNAKFMKNYNKGLNLLTKIDELKNQFEKMREEIAYSEFNIPLSYIESESLKIDESIKYLDNENNRRVYRIAMNQLISTFKSPDKWGSDGDMNPIEFYTSYLYSYSEFISEIDYRTNPKFVNDNCYRSFDILDKNKVEVQEVLKLIKERDDFNTEQSDQALYEIMHDL